MAQNDALTTVEVKGFRTPDETRTFPKGRLQLLYLGDAVVGKLTLEPGWRLTEQRLPMTEWGEIPHFQYHVSGCLRVKMGDGREYEIGSEDVSVFPRGQDAWVIGNEPAVLIGWYTADAYTSKK